MKIVVAGGTGFIGGTLVKRLAAEGHEIVVLTRRGNYVIPGSERRLRYVTWDPLHPGPWREELADASAVINLAGEAIASCRWTSSRKDKIIASRVVSTQGLVDGVRRNSRRPRVLINASAIGWYGDRGDAVNTEEAPRGKGFLAEVCWHWENAAREAERWGVRVVLPRFGLVLEKHGGVLAKMLPPFKAFAGGPLGSGRQWLSWIHLEDVIGSVQFLLTNESLCGPVNLTAPEPVTMSKFCRTLARVLRRPSWLSVPGPALNILMGEMSQMILMSQKVLPSKLQTAGYVFKYPELNEALQAVLLKKI